MSASSQDNTVGGMYMLTMSQKSGPKTSCRTLRFSFLVAGVAGRGLEGFDSFDNCDE